MFNSNDQDKGLYDGVCFGTFAGCVNCSSSKRAAPASKPTCREQQQVVPEDIRAPRRQRWHGIDRALPSVIRSNTRSQGIRWMNFEYP